MPFSCCLTLLCNIYRRLFEMGSRLHYELQVRNVQLLQEIPCVCRKHTGNKVGTEPLTLSEEVNNQQSKSKLYDLTTVENTFPTNPNSIGTARNSASAHNRLHSIAEWSDRADESYHHGPVPLDDAYKSSRGEICGRGTIDGGAYPDSCKLSSSSGQYYTVSPMDERETRPILYLHLRRQMLVRSTEDQGQKAGPKI